MHRTGFRTKESGNLIGRSFLWGLAGIFLSQVVCGQLLDRIAARVNGNVILESEITFESRLMRLYPDSKNGKVPVRSEVLDKLIDRELMMDQARKFVTKHIAETEIDNRIRVLDDKYGGPQERIELLKMTGSTEEYWRIRIHHQILLEKYIDQRFRAFVRISRSEEDQYILDHIEELNLTRFEDPLAAVPETHELREVIRNLLTEKVVDVRISELIEELRTSAEIFRADILSVSHPAGPPGANP